MARKIIRLLVFFFFLQKVTTLHGSPKKTLKISINGYNIRNIGIDLARWLSPREFFIFSPCVNVIKESISELSDCFEFSYGPKSLLRRIQIEQAILIAHKIATIATRKNVDGSFIYKNIEIKGWSLGSSIAIYSIAILCEIQSKNKKTPIDTLINRVIEQVPLMTPTIKSFAKLIKNKTFKVKLITVGTPITKELNKICNHQRFLNLINAHYHFFYHNDWIARIDPGFSSEVMSLPYKKATAFSARKSKKMIRQQIHLNVSKRGFECAIKQVPYLQKTNNHSIISYLASKADFAYFPEAVSDAEFFEINSLEPLIVKKRSKEYFEKRNCFLKQDIFEMKKATLKKALYSLGILIGLDRYFGLTEKIKSKSSSVLKF